MLSMSSTTKLHSQPSEKNLNGGAAKSGECFRKIILGMRWGRVGESDCRGRESFEKKTEDEGSNNAGDREVQEETDSEDT